MSEAPPPTQQQQQQQTPQLLALEPLSEAVQAAIDEVMPPSEALDRADFSPVAYINEMFPTAASLGGVDGAVAKLTRKVRRLDDELAAAVRQQVDAGDRGRQELAAAQASVAELAAKIAAIRDKAEASERMVTEICRHIKSLDNGKRNLTVSIKTLRKLQMLSSGVDQLGHMLQQGHYREAASNIEAVGQLLGDFSAFGHVPKVRELNEAVVRLRGDASRLVFEEFRAVFDARRPVAGLADVCDLVDALGAEKRKEFVLWFCDTRLEDYKRHFNPYAESSRLDFVERRYSWFSDALRTFGETFADVFPEDWEMGSRFAEEFCCTTRLALLELLKTTRDTLNVTALVMALQRTIEFEKGLVALFEPEDPRPPPVTPIDDTPAIREFKDDEQSATPTTTPEAVSIAPPPKRFKGIISSAFDPYMDLYIAQEDRNVRDMLERALKDEKWTTDEDSPTKVLGSCTDIIYYMKTSMTRCVALSTGQPLLDLHAVFRKHIHAYTLALVQHLPQDSLQRASERELKTACLITNTGEFARTRCEQFQRTFQKRIVEKLRDSVDFKPEATELKQTVVSRGVNLLAQLLCNKLDPSLAEMSKMPWATIEVVGDTSPYVGTIITTLESDIPHIRKWLTDCPGISSKHWSLFLDVFVTRFSANHLDAIYRCKRISEVGAQGLLLDVSCLRTMLTKLPILGTPEASGSTVAPGSDDYTAMASGPSPPPAASAGRSSEHSRFAKFVETSMRKAEVLLKVVLAPQETLAHTYRALVTGGTLENFQRIVELKGLSKSERQQLIETFQQQQQQAARHLESAEAAAASAFDAGAGTVSAAALAPSSASTTSSSSSAVPLVNPQAAQELRSKTKSLIGKMLGPLHSNS